MKGKILDFNETSRSGVISGDDGNRYNFVENEWKSATQPKAGSNIDFSTNGENAESIYVESYSPSGSSKKIPAALFA
ncbi:MAG: hypothetical protein ACTILC_11915, partial [Oceanisphaera sp.]